MTSLVQQRLELQEYAAKRIPQSDIPQALCEKISSLYGQIIDITPPWKQNGYTWELAPRGYVGYLPVTPEFGIHLQPKVPLKNLFGMWEYAYDLRSIQFFSGLTANDSLEEVYGQLASVLSKRILQRGRKGFYRSYVSFEEESPFVRGRLDVSTLLRRPWTVQPRCSFEEHTGDIEDNQILAWALDRVLASGICREPSRRVVSRAARELQGLCSLRPFTAESCECRVYNRLNSDYDLLHGLSRFFLSNSGPGHASGERTMAPFVVDMAKLFERFVAKWLESHPPAGLVPRSHERVYLGDTGSIVFDIDLVLRNTANGATEYVLDTKYKTPDARLDADIKQVVAYAESKQCSEAVLVYPAPPKHPVDIRVGDIHVQSQCFSLEGDLEDGGQAFLRSLIGSAATAPSSPNESETAPRATPPT